MKQEQFAERLGNGIVHFSYRKSDGSIREAFGTVNQNLIPKYKSDKVTSLLEAVHDLSQTVSKVRQTSKNVSQFDDTVFDVPMEVLEEALKPFQPKEKRPYTQNEEWVNYYDLEKQEFRKFKFGELEKVF